MHVRDGENLVLVCCSYNYKGGLGPAWATIMTWRLAAVAASNWHGGALASLPSLLCRMNAPIFSSSLPFSLLFCFDDLDWTGQGWLGYLHGAVTLSCVSPPSLLSLAMDGILGNISCCSE